MNDNPESRRGGNSQATHLRDTTISTDQPLLVVTGAGVSAASGIPLFRGTDPDAVWNQNVLERGTFRYFRDDPAASWSWYLGRFESLRDASPNPAHHALAAMEDAWHADFLLVTQNVDGLHREAGSRALVEVHGRADRVRCANDGCENAAPRGSLPRDEGLFARFREDPSVANLPCCPRCGDFLRPHVLWFDERYDEHRDYAIDTVLRAAKKARAVLFAGTSFSVGVTAMVLETALRRGAEVLSVDPSGRSPHPRVRVIASPAEEAFPAMVQPLRAA
ncbi:MAG: Sir2 family NAD-dependent protein deacetylase [Myxococcota bacterium]